ncbi:DUF6507 family protein [Streptomyces indicus]|uniref:Uncharacterized protein n=1 Tax=Streptomyces indicus TaxID=417292 RepID=A0A1G9JI43_9ACTN|nr:DUF6507 family protein [Streptomyces indicus]SDL36774.1 hypothetical protein SAMN05421806_1312 [Streptomyces indicus]
MTGWDIRPQGVQGQLGKTATQAGELEKALTSLLTHLQEAAQAAGTAVPGSQAMSTVPGSRGPDNSPLTQKALGPVAAGIGAFVDGKKKDLTSMAENVEASMTGAALATREYVEGDLETAKQAQDAARTMNLDVLRDLRGDAK